jgi:hypothetical protein
MTALHLFLPRDGGSTQRDCAEEKRRKFEDYGWQKCNFFVAGEQTSRETK